LVSSASWVLAAKAEICFSISIPSDVFEALDSLAYVERKTRSKGFKYLIPEVKAVDLCPEHGISEATFRNQQSKHDGLDVSEAKRPPQMKDEDRRLKKLVADLSQTARR
jgi:Transposase